MDPESHCHTVHYAMESGSGSARSLLHDFSPGFGPAAAGTVIWPLAEKHGLHITKGKLNSSYDKNIAKFSTIYPKALLSVCVCHKLRLNNARFCLLIARDFALFACKHLWLFLQTGKLEHCENWGKSCEGRGKDASEC